MDGDVDGPRFTQGLCGGDDGGQTYTERERCGGEDGWSGLKEKMEYGKEGVYFDKNGGQTCTEGERWWGWMEWIEGKKGGWKERSIYTRKEGRRKDKGMKEGRIDRMKALKQKKKKKRGMKVYGKVLLACVRARVCVQSRFTIV